MVPVSGNEVLSRRPPIAAVRSRMPKRSTWEGPVPRCHGRLGANPQSLSSTRIYRRSSSVKAKAIRVSVAAAWSTTLNSSSHTD